MTILDSLGLIVEEKKKDPASEKHKPDLDLMKMKINMKVVRGIVHQ